MVDAHDSVTRGGAAWISLSTNQFTVEPQAAISMQVGQNISDNRPFPPTFVICRNCQKLRYWVGFVGVLSVNAGERRSPSERSNPAFRVCIN